MNKYEKALIEHNANHNPMSTSTVLVACKKAQVLDFIIKKGVDVGFIKVLKKRKVGNIRKAYNSWCYDDEMLNEKEFDLLKEVLKEEENE